jgi:proteic killer suppression protein
MDDEVMAIQSFRCAETRREFERLRVKRFVKIEGPARRQ